MYPINPREISDRFPSITVLRVFFYVGVIQRKLSVHGLHFVFRVGGREHTIHFLRVSKILPRPDASFPDRLRLVLLTFLRHNSDVILSSLPATRADFESWESRRATRLGKSRDGLFRNWVIILSN